MNKCKLYTAYVLTYKSIVIALNNKKNTTDTAIIIISLLYGLIYNSTKYGINKNEHKYEYFEHYD